VAKTVTRPGGGPAPDGDCAALPTGVVLDLDDTLMDTSGIEAEMLVALCDAVRAELPEVDDAELRRRWTDGRDELYERVLRGEWDVATYRRVHLEAVLAPWGAPSEALATACLRLRDEQLERARFAEHAVELLRGLRAAGVRTVLLTNGPTLMQRRKVELLQLEPELDAVGISEELRAAKPDPAAFAAALDLIDCPPGEAVMVGDHLAWDVRGALDAGLRGAIWVSGDPGDARRPPPGALRVAGLAEVPAALARLA
jgi:putative hydrolase of the HAD superfamily